MRGVVEIPGQLEMKPDLRLDAKEALEPQRRVALPMHQLTGIPLPFFSNGGSFMLSSWLALGILLRIAAEGRSGMHGLFAVQC